MDAPAFATGRVAADRDSLERDRTTVETVDVDAAAHVATHAVDDSDVGETQCAGSATGNRSAFLRVPALSNRQPRDRDVTGAGVDLEQPVERRARRVRTGGRGPATADLHCSTGPTNTPRTS